MMETIKLELGQKVRIDFDNDFMVIEAIEDKIGKRLVWTGKKVGKHA